MRSHERDHVRCCTASSGMIILNFLVWCNPIYNLFVFCSVVWDQFNTTYIISYWSSTAGGKKNNDCIELSKRGYNCLRIQLFYVMIYFKNDTVFLHCRIWVSQKIEVPSYFLVRIPAFQWIWMNLVELQKNVKYLVSCCAPLQFSQQCSFKCATVPALVRCTAVLR